MLKEGVKGTQEIMVTEENTAKVMGSGALDVFATPAMIALMEKTAWESVQPYLEEGSGTVGTLMNVKHVAASPVGMKITCETELTKVDGRALTFSVKAFDEAGLIGHQAGQRMGLPKAVRVASGVSPDTLHIVKGFLVDDGLVGVLKNRPLAFIHIVAFLVLEMLAGFEIDRMA